ncbi:hypothetical protein Ndes2437A_g00605 [Nannochloris sp. 'desiccata']
MTIPIVLIVILPILCAIFGFAFGFAAARWRSYVGKHKPYFQSSVRNNSAEVSVLEQIKVETLFSPCVESQHAASRISTQLVTGTSTEDQFNIGLPPPGLAQIRTPVRHSSGDFFNLDSQQAKTPVNMTTPLNRGTCVAAKPALGRTPYTTTRHGSPTAHLMGHLVRCASQAIDQIESRSVLQRLTSTDAAAGAETPFFAASSPMPSSFLLSPAAGTAGVDQNNNQYLHSNNNNSTAFSTGADEIHMDEVDLISKLGGGAFGSVYRGAWRGAPVAVKYIRTRTDKADSLGDAIREIVLSKKLTHPNIVQTFSWTVLAQPPVLDDEDKSIAGVLDFSRNESDVSEIAWLSYSLLHRNGSREEGERKQQEGAPTATVTTEAEELERYSIPAVWNNTASTTRAANSIPLIEEQQKQQLRTTTTKTGSPSSSSSSLTKGVKRRRTGLDSAIPSPTTLGLDPRMDSFNSEEGFGSPVKKKHGGVQSIFNLESLQLTETEALLVVVMEHCDLGSLQRALQRKAFLPSAKWPQHATFRALLRTAAEIAKGMEYIHGQHGVVHGDLKPANVLLKTHRADRRGYIAKVADFGLSWHVHVEGGEENQLNLREDSANTVANSSENEIHSSSNNNNLSASTGGTTAYLPPEAFEDSTPRGRPGDVYAFGVMLWSMYYCKNPYEGMLEAQVCAGVLNGWLRPEFTEDCPAAFRLLAERCWSQNAIDRPTFAHVWRELVNIEVDFRSQRLRSRSGGVVGGECTKRPASAPIKGEMMQANCGGDEPSAADKAVL